MFRAVLQLIHGTRPFSWIEHWEYAELKQPLSADAPCGEDLEVTPRSRLFWSNDESPYGAITTVTFEERGGNPQVVVHDLYPSKEALEAAIASESTGGFTEQFEQLDELLVTLGASAGQLESQSAGYRTEKSGLRSASTVEMTPTTAGSFVGAI
jgi:hypothetical protein